MKRVCTLGLVLTLLIWATGSATAQAEDPAGTQYTAVDRVETDQGTVIDAGSVVDVLGVIDVSREVAPSGRLLTFRFEDGIYTADVAGFAPAQSDRFFAVRSVYAGTVGDRAELCATLYSRSSGEAADLSDLDLRSYLQVERDGRRVADYSLQVSPVLCLRGLDFSTSYQVTIRKGLAVGDRQVTSDIVFYGRTGDREPAISLNAASYILPVGERSLLPVTTVNVSELEVEVFRIDPRTLVQVPDLFSHLDGYDAGRLRAHYGELVGRRSIALATRRNENLSFNLDLAALVEGRDPGLFVAVLSSPQIALARYRNRPTQWFAHSNIGITTYSGVGETLVSMADFRTLEPVVGGRVQVLAGNNRELFAATSDAAGTVRIPHAYLAGSGGNAPELMIVTTSGGDFSLADVSDLKAKPRFLAAGVDKPHQQDVHLAVEREMFRVGEDVDFHVLARDLALDPLADYHLDVTFTDPQGKRVAVQGIVTNAHGVAAGKLPVGPTYLLGAYRIQVARKDGVILADRRVRVEDFVPLTIETALSVGEQVWAAEGEHRFAIEGAYLSGGPSRGLRGDYRSEVRATRTHEGGGLDGFVFGSVQSADFRFMTEAREFTLDDAGRFTGSVDLDEAPDLPPGMYQVGILAAVRDVGGRPNRGSATVPLDTHASYVGLRPEFGERLGDGAAAAFSVVRIDRLGTRLADVDLPYHIVRVRYSYDWYYDDGWRWRRTRRADETVASGTTAGGTLVSGTPFDWGSHELIVEDVSGFRTVLPFFVGWGSSDGLPASEPERLDTFVDIGDDGAGVLRASLPFAGVLRIHVAHSDVIATEVVRVTKGDVEIPLDIPLMPEPGFHVLATLIRPIEAGTEHLPQIALGSTWVPSLGAERDLGLRVSAPEVVRSTDAIAVSVQANVQTGSLVLYLVDEGIHALTGFRNEDPTEFFYGERELSIGFASNYGRLIRQDVTLPTYRAGGDEAGEGDRVLVKSEFFKTVAAASPVLPIENGRAVHEFDRPDVEGRLRLVAVAASEHGVGFQERTVQVRDPVSLDVSLPRFIGTGDRLVAQVALRANESAASVRLEERVGAASDSTRFALAEGTSLQSGIAISSPVAGLLPVEIRAAFGEMRVVRDFELLARVPSYPQVALRSLPLKTALLARRAVVPALTLSEFDVAGQTDLEYRVTVSRTPGAALGQLLAALHRYPYGCIEQVSSATRGLVFREQLGSRRYESARELIDRGVERIVANQNVGGAFGYWDRFDSVREEFQPYAVETLMLALPYATDREKVTAAIDKGLGYLYAQHTTDLWTRLYAYGVLARAGYEVTSRARYAIDHELWSGLREGGGDARERLDRISIAYWLADILNDRTRLNRLHDALEEVLADGPATAFRDRKTWTDSLNLFADHGTHRRYTAPNNAHLLAQVSSANQTPLTVSLVQRTGAYLSAREYRSTYVNSRLAQMAFAGATGLAGEVVRIDDRDYRIAEDGSIDVSPDLLRSRFEVRHRLNQPLFLNVEVAGQRTTTAPIENGFSITKTWYDSAGEPIPLDGGPLVANQGDLFTVVLEIVPTRPGLSGDTLLTDLLPSGFELEAADVAPPATGEGEAESGKRPEYVQNMDDRFVAYFTGRWSHDRRTVVAYAVRAVFPGEMVVPDAHVELMYQPEINGRSMVRRAQILAG